MGCYRLLCLLGRFVGVRLDFVDIRGYGGYHIHVVVVIVIGERQVCAVCVHSRRDVPLSLDDVAPATLIASDDGVSLDLDEVIRDVTGSDVDDAAPAIL